MSQRRKRPTSTRLHVKPLEERAVLAYVPFLEQPPILTNANGASSLVAEDLDMDGDADIIAGFADRVVWYENVNGLGTIGPSRTLDTELTVVRAVRAADIDGDGDLDAVSLTRLTTSWYENTNGRDLFGPPRVIAGGPGGTLRGQRDVLTVDFDLDGDIDIRLTTINEVFWFENTDGLGTFGAKQLLVERPAWTRAIHAADIDADGDFDVVSSGRVFAWNENLGNQVVGPQQRIDDLERDGLANMVSTADFALEIPVLSTSAPSTGTETWIWSLR